MLEPFDNTTFKLDTLIGNKTTCADLVKVTIQSLDTDELFCEVNAVVHPLWVDDAGSLPHMQNFKSLKHFDGVEIFSLEN